MAFWIRGFNNITTEYKEVQESKKIKPRLRRTENKLRKVFTFVSSYFQLHFYTKFKELVIILGRATD